MRGWYTHTQHSLASLLKREGTSIIRLLHTKSTDELHVQLQNVSRRLYIHELEDFYHVPISHLKLVDGVSPLLRKYSSVEALVRAAYPSHTWEHDRFMASTRGKTHFAPQTFLMRIVRSIFPSTIVEMNVRSELQGSRAPLEIDVFLLEYKLGFEYQDHHHYFHSSYGACTLDEYQARDREKKVLANKKGITLIYVPFWWDWNVESLIATIKAQRPDLLTNVQCSAEPLNPDPPQHIIDKWDYEVPDLGIPMLALYLPKGAFDPTKWWVFEKYDGVRAVWSGPKSTFYTRWGTPFVLPHFITDSLPQMWFDGEIWFGRQRRTRSIATRITSRANHNAIAWEKFKFMLFDMPQPGMRHKAYHKRYAQLQSICNNSHPFVQLAGYEICKDKDGVETMFFNIRVKEGEGVILRDPNAPYVNGYSRFLYKFRGMSDAEALILEKISDTRYICKINRRQLQFNAGESYDNESNESEFLKMEMVLDEAFEGELGELEVGKFVSFRYTSEAGSTSGPPVNPRIYALRDDIRVWEQLMHSKRKSPSHERIFTPIIHKNQWTTHDQIRTNFDHFAKRRDFDPLEAKNWYGLRTEVIKEFPSVAALKYLDILTDTYPEVKFDPALINQGVPAKYWDEDEARRRSVFDAIARSLSFDPLVPENWYSLSWQDLFLDFKMARSLYNSEKKTLGEVLQDVYPEVPFRIHNFIIKPKGFFEDKENLRKFLENFAAKKGFDPLVFVNWQNVRKVDLFEVTGGPKLWRMYNSLQKAVVDLFPEIKTPPLRLEREYLNGVEKRKFFEEFARKRGFDPLVPDNWYTIVGKRTLRKELGEKVVGRYSYTEVTALKQAFPALGLQASKFKHIPEKVLKSRGAIRTLQM